MKILLITQEPPLNENEIVSGNAVRTVQLATALRTADHRVSQTWLSKERKRDSGSFRNRDELRGILIEQSPEVIIVSYWELLGFLPFDYEQPVILDFVAPRPLEELYESADIVANNLRRMRDHLQRCDAVMVGNEMQGHLLVYTLIEAGFDLRDESPILVVPLGGKAVSVPQSDPREDGWLFVTGGVDWPWRHSAPYIEALNRFARDCRPAIRIVHFGGRYRWHHTSVETEENNPQHGPENITHRGLEPYVKFSEFLTTRAHVGVELAEWNLERHYSQSFRSLEFLRHGLPLLCNRYLAISALIEFHDAGWIIEEPAALEPTLKEIIADPERWRRKSANALKLVSEELNPDRSARELLGWLESPAKATRLPRGAKHGQAAPVLGVPPIRDRVRRQYGLVKQALFARIFGQKRGRGVLIVTRSDLFPPDHGAAVRTVESARALSRLGLNVGIVTDDQKHWHRFENGREESASYPWWTRMLSLPGPLIKLLHFSKDMPFSNSFLYLPLTDHGFRWRIISAARKLHAGILQAEFPAYAAPCLKIMEALGCSLVLVEHNVEYERIRSQVEDLSDDQYQRLKSIETSLCNRSDAVVCVSDNDRQKLLMDGVSPELMHTIGHGVDLEQYDNSPVEPVRERYGIGDDSLLIVYHGTFSYPPNLQALRIFAEILLPGLEQRNIDCHVLAVGKSPPARSPHPRIHFTGSVTRVAPWLKAADLAVVPLTEGGGTRMKIIDCFAARLPLISTSKGIEGIPVVNGKHALVLDDWASIINAICELRDHPERARALAQEGHRLAAHLDWRLIAEQYTRLYASLV